MTRTHELPDFSIVDSDMRLLRESSTALSSLTEYTFGRRDGIHEAVAGYIRQMIIEAGYDVFQLLAPKLLRRRRMRDATYVLILDENLRFIWLAKVPAVSEDPFEEHARIIHSALATDRHFPAKYFVVGRLVTGVPCDRSSSDDHDGSEICSDVPRFSFRDYPRLEHLPRSESFPGPHTGGDDCCAACKRFNNRFATNRRRTEALDGLEQQFNE